MARKLVHLRILRQDSPSSPTSRRWEEFKVPYLPQMNVISALQQIQKFPTTTDGKDVAPVSWESSCLEEVCGSCTMLINGKARQACSALIDTLAPNGELITVEPMSKFPLVRDLIVDRTRMFESLKTVKAWIHLDGTHELGAGPRESQDDQQTRYAMSRCMTCGCCVEACPQYSDKSPFIGPAALNQVRLFNMHPSGKMHANERLEAVMGDGGVADCGKAQNCVEVCPKEIPLVESIAVVSRDTTKRMLFGWLLGLGTTIMTNKAGARVAAQNLYVTRQQAAAVAPARRNVEAQQRALQAKAREARAVAAAKKAADKAAAVASKAAAAPFETKE